MNRALDWTALPMLAELLGIEDVERWVLGLLALQGALAKHQPEG